MVHMKDTNLLLKCLLLPKFLQENAVVPSFKIEYVKDEPHEDKCVYTFLLWTFSAQERNIE